MKKRRIFTLAIAFLLTSSSTSIWATSTDIALEEECQNMAFEQQIPEEDLETFIADCMTAEIKNTETHQEESNQPVQE